MRKTLCAFQLLAAAMLTVPAARASLVGTVPMAPGDIVFPGLTSAPAGVLLASLAAPWTSSSGTSSGTLVSAVFREAGGTLDFYYQVTNNLTAQNCGSVSRPACDPLAREIDTSFLAFQTFVGYRTDGGSLPSGIFVNGTVPPITADRSVIGDVVGFSFNPPGSAKIQPGQTSYVLVISTDALNFTNGTASVVDGGVTTVASFEPAATAPEPVSWLLLGAGLAGLIGLGRFRA